MSAADPELLRVLIVDDHEVFAESLQAVIAEEPDVEVVGIAGSGAAAVREAAALAPDLILLDQRLPDARGVELIRRLQAAGGPATRVVMLTASTSDQVLLAAVEAGAAGFVDKSRAMEGLASVIASIRSGGSDGHA
jgi:two-component system nitrate/nitrite response regulator NarL